MLIKRGNGWALIGLAALMLISSVVLSVRPVGAQVAQKPLLIPGKQTLFQRVVTHPGANLYAAAGPQTAILEAQLAPFTVFYVYERILVEDQSWLFVGASSNRGPTGWLKGEQVSDWWQSMTLKFTPKIGRRPVLFFKDLTALENVAGAADPGGDAAALIDQFNVIRDNRSEPPEDFAVIALEPESKDISSERFYLVPIFETAQIFEGVKFLEVASIDPGSGWEPEQQGDLRTAIVFVIDTTISMRPYIDRTRAAVRKIYDAIEKAGLADKVAFGLVAFRNSTAKSPGLGYVSTVISDLRDGGEREQFEDALGSVREATVSSHSFNEDAFAGLKTALEELNWSSFQSRVTFLITDAGAIRNNDPYSSTGMNETEIADMAAAKGVKIFALHLKTPAGDQYHANNHAIAESQYRTLTGQFDTRIGDLYIPIKATLTQTGVETFGRVIESVATKMIDLVWSTSAGQQMALPTETEPSGDDVVDEAERKAAIVGYAMQLDYLGKREGVRAPEVVRSWVSDMDLNRPDTPAFQVCVLLNKNQLSDLYQRLKIILDQAQRTKRTGARDFFQSILSAAVQSSRDPKRFSRNPDQNLGQLGFMSEFLEDLPYRSSIMRLTEEDWYAMSVGEQQALINDIKSKIRRYLQYHNDTDNWVSFGAMDPGEAVYRVPLSMMP